MDFEMMSLMMTMITMMMEGEDASLINVRVSECAIRRA